MSLSAAQIVAQVERVLDSDPGALTVAIRASGRQPWPESLRQRGREFRIRWCDSTLAIREALCDVERQDPATAGLVVITPLSTHEIAVDIAARFARARVFQPEGWELVRQLFQAKETDSRLGQYAWMPQILIDGATQGPYPPVANGFLDLETAWREVLYRSLGLADARPDAVALLNWTIAPGADARLGSLPGAARPDVMRWLGQSAGIGGEMVLGCIDAGRTADAVPLGLVCGVIFATEGAGETGLGQAAIRLERFVDGRHVGPPQGRAWAGAATQVIRQAGIDASRAMLDRADALLRDLRIIDFAHLSDVLPMSLDQRLGDFAAALTAHVVTPSTATLAEVEARADRTLRHMLLTTQSARLERVEMARRLARWLICDTPTSTSLPDAVAWQSDHGAFVDWARFRLLGGDELPDLSQAYGACRDAVIARRNDFAKLFAQALMQWSAQRPSPDGRIVPLESVIEHVIAPIAASQPMLLLVMDGLSASIFRELFARISALGWTELVPSGLGRSLAGVAALPSVTEVCRASLLCGRLMAAGSAQEKSGFATHPALLSLSRADAPPRLFHKGDLADAGNLANDVRAAIASSSQRVVGVVYNAVDDHLSGPEQLHQRWALEDLRLLLPLLREAREARRVVVITADHGHLLEDGTAQLPGGESDRWRPGARANSPDEMVVGGPRIVTTDGSDAIVCLWGERTRYAGRKNGYHGGLSPQEITVPLSVIAPLGLDLDGWIVAPPAQPDWWELSPLPKASPLRPADSAPARHPRRKSTPPQAQTPLLAPGGLPPRAPAAPTATPDWIATLLNSPVYASQRQLAARVAPPEDKIRLLLEALSERGGKLSRTALASRLSLPEIRMGGLLSAVRRILNVDQAAVLVVDDATGMVELNDTLLRQQFRLSATGGPA